MYVCGPLIRKQKKLKKDLPIEKKRLFYTYPVSQRGKEKINALRFPFCSFHCNNFLLFPFAKKSLRKRRKRQKEESFTVIEPTSY